MTAVKQRNPYLKRLSSNTPHKYSYDIQTGKYMLHTSTGKDMQINKIGTLKPKFRNNFSGFANSKQRYTQAINQPALMHFTPQLRYNHSRSFYTPKPQKFAGYSQFPYKIASTFPQHLCSPVPCSIESSTKQIPSSTHSSLIMMRKCHSQNKSTKAKQSSSIILQNSSTSFLNHEEKDQYFSMSFTNITQSKPLPRKVRKQCYNYKCKHAKKAKFNSQPCALGIVGLAKSTIRLIKAFIKPPSNFKKNKLNLFNLDDQYLFNFDDQSHSQTNSNKIFFSFNQSID